MGKIFPNSPHCEGSGLPSNTMFLEPPKVFTPNRILTSSDFFCTLKLSWAAWQTDWQSDRQIPWPPWTIICISCIWCSLIIIIKIQHWNSRSKTYIITQTLANTGCDVNTSLPCAGKLLLPHLIRDNYLQLQCKNRLYFIPEPQTANRSNRPQTETVLFIMLSFTPFSNAETILQQMFRYSQYSLFVWQNKRSRMPNTWMQEQFFTPFSNAVTILQQMFRYSQYSLFMWQNKRSRMLNTWMQEQFWPCKHNDTWYLDGCYQNLKI